MTNGKQRTRDILSTLATQNYTDVNKLTKSVNQALDSIEEVMKESTRQTNIRQIENWRDWINPNLELQWLVEEMDSAIESLRDATQTDENGTWLEFTDNQGITPEYLNTATKN